MKAKFVNESLNEFVGESPRMTPETFSQIVDDLISEGDLDAAVETIKRIFKENPEINSEIGEIPGRDLYAEPWQRFEAWYESNQ